MKDGTTMTWAVYGKANREVAALPIGPVEAPPALMDLPLHKPGQPLSTLCTDSSRRIA